MKEVGADTPHSGDYRLFLANGGLATLAGRFASPQVVLPWAYSIIHGPLFLIGLLIPCVRTGSIVAQIAVIPMLRAHRFRKWLNVVASLTVAALLALVYFAALELTVYAATVIFFVSMLGLGAATGVVELTSQDVMAKTIPRPQISRLVATQASFGGFLTLSVALGMFLWDPYPGSRASHLS